MPGPTSSSCWPPGGGPCPSPAGQCAIRWYVFGAAQAFLASLAFRSMDLASCEATRAIGTHFIWHLLNGTMIGLLLLGLIRKLPPQP
ncbi:hypothetical protein [Pseudooceanicola sp. HF7]|uniref:hypothetical protein n=1 Tax=Pseudooceanicola sp. HF7 TaxID=2721560 RepID=UPI001431F4D5|nr:hypothetical protein [Pseudooceanicola sp. HF7]NIZ09689.1 hypothetical protein [Pseudooceanicola sp. HF7]